MLPAVALRCEDRLRTLVSLTLFGSRHYTVEIAQFGNDIENRPRGRCKSWLRAAPGPAAPRARASHTQEARPAATASDVASDSEEWSAESGDEPSELQELASPSAGRLWLWLTKRAHTESCSTWVGSGPGLG